MKIVKTMSTVLAVAVSLLFINTANAASWGVSYDGWGLSGYPCGGGSGWVWDPVFTIYTITEPADWPAVSQFGHELSFPGGSPFYSDSTTNNSSGIALGKTGTIPVYGSPYAFVTVESHHWATYNGTYIDTTKSAGGSSSGCF